MGGTAIDNRPMTASVVVGFFCPMKVQRSVEMADLNELSEKLSKIREEIIEDLWNDSLYVDENTLYVNINRLREKLKQIEATDFIKTVRGVGYRL